MSPLFMDTGYEPNSPGLLSTEERHSNDGSEREGEARQMGKRGTKRQEKNRDAARKSRRKQTERADELHEELQCLERSNSALQKEIASLKKELHLYTNALERHEPFCCLQNPTSSSSTAHLSVSLPADSQTGSSPPGLSPESSSSAQAAAPSFSTSTSSLGIRTIDSVQNTHLSSSAPAPTTATLASSPGSSSELLTSSSSSTVPYSASFSTVQTPHSLFTKVPLSLVTSRLTDFTPVHTSHVSIPVPCSGTLDPFFIKSASFLTASSNVDIYSHKAVDNEGLVAQDSPVNAIQLHQGHFGQNPINSSSPRSLLPSTFQDPALQSISVLPQTNLDSSTSSAFPLKSSYSQHVTPNAASLLSLLTTPSPLNVSQTTSSSFDGHLSLPPHSPPPSGDISLSEFLEVNDWILQ